MRYHTEEVLQIAKAIRDDSAGNKQATMTEMDLAGNMLESLTRHRDQLRAEVEALRKEALNLCDAVENVNDLPPAKYAIQAGRAVNKVRDAAAAMAAKEVKDD